MIQGARAAKASRICAVDINEGKFDIAKELGATDFVNPKKFDKPIQQVSTSKILPLKKVFQTASASYTLYAFGDGY